jgi:hypothetical protein
MLRANQVTLLIKYLSGFQLTGQGHYMVFRPMKMINFVADFTMKLRIVP